MQPNEELHQRLKKLEAAIRKHRDTKADDRCIEDDDELYAALGDGIKCDRRVGDKFEMLKNCARFIERRCHGGNWPTYVELESTIEKLEEIIDCLDEMAMEGFGVVWHGGTFRPFELSIKDTIRWVDCPECFDDDFKAAVHKSSEFMWERLGP